MEWIVTTGQTVDEAREAALDELGVHDDELEYEVLDEPKAGLFGMVRREARIRARVAPAEPRPKVERRPRRNKGAKGSKQGGRSGGGRSGGKGEQRSDDGGKGRRGGSKGSKDADRRSGGTKGEASEPADRPAADVADEPESELAVAESPAPPSDGDAGPATAPPGAARGRSRRRKASNGPEDEAPATAAAGSTDAAPATADAQDEGSDGGAAADDGSSGGRRRRRPRGGRTRSGGRAPAAGKEQGSTDEGGKVSKVTMDEQIEVVEEFLDGLLEAFDLEGDIDTEKVDDENAEVRVEGDDLGLLIGPKGQTLNAVQDLARTVVQRRLAGSLEGRVRVDVGGYRQRRRAALERFARQVAEDVLDSGSQKVLEPMNPADRKVVHDTINEIDGVTTISEGEEPRRRVVVQPVDA